VEQSLKKHILAVGSKGFTLIEVMIVISILGVLLALGTPGFKSMIDKQRVRGTCETIYQNIALARSSAASLNRNVTVTIGGGATTSWCLGVNDTNAVGCDCTNAAAANCQVNGIQRTASYSEFGNSPITVTPGTSSTSIVFSARDAAPTTPIIQPTGDISVKSPFWACNLRVEPLGQVRYLKNGSGTNSRAIVPGAEAAGLSN
jgi:prepilin-type N-terminal cleavage/methylation domain-containing protein